MIYKTIYSHFHFRLRNQCGTLHGLRLTLLRTGRDTYQQFHQGMPDGALVAGLIRSATGPPLSSKLQSTPPAQDPLPPNESPYFTVAAHVARATADFDLSRTLTRADLSRRLGERRREAQAANSQYSQDFGHKMFGSSK
jgi:hypothetical protein